MDDATTIQPTLDDIAEAMAAADGVTPQLVLDAFLPLPIDVAGHRLKPIRVGHELFLGRLSHPFVTKGKAVEDIDLFAAFYVFSRTSRELFEQVADGTFEGLFFAFIDSLPPADLEAIGAAVIQHWLSSRATALSMQAPADGSKKKQAVNQAVSAGC